VLGETRARDLAVLKRAKRMAMSSQGLMCCVAVILADLVMPRRLAMKIRRVFVMHRCSCMLICRVVCDGHELPFVASRLSDPKTAK
jgi:hypothetical protein